LISATIHLLKGPVSEHMHMSMCVCVCVWCGGIGCVHRTSHYWKTSRSLLLFSCMYLDFRKWTTS